MLGRSRTRHTDMNKSTHSLFTAFEVFIFSALFFFFSRSPFPVDLCVRFSLALFVQSKELSHARAHTVHRQLKQTFFSFRRLPHWHSVTRSISCVCVVSLDITSILNFWPSTALFLSSTSREDFSYEVISFLILCFNIFFIFFRSFALCCLRSWNRLRSQTSTINIKLVSDRLKIASLFVVGLVFSLLCFFSSSKSKPHIHLSPHWRFHSHGRRQKRKRNIHRDSQICTECDWFFFSLLICVLCVPFSVSKWPRIAMKSSSIKVDQFADYRRFHLFAVRISIWR